MKKACCFIIRSLIIFLALSMVFIAGRCHADSSKIDTKTIKTQLAILRGLSFRQDPPWQYKEKEELQKSLEKKMADDKNRKNLEAFEAFLKWQRLVPDGFDLKSNLSEFLSKKIGGYYDTNTKTFYICRKKTDVDLPSVGKVDYDKVTALHEMDHALQDQHFDLKRLHGMMEKPDNDDMRNAVRSLIEGDASYVTMDYLFKELDIDLFTVPNINDIIKILFAHSSSKKQTVPPYFQESLAEPYIEGFRFIRDLIIIGGWPLINSIYDDLPDSTEQVLHTEKYLFQRDFPWSVKLTRISDELPGGWNKIEENTMGELQMRTLLNCCLSGLNKNRFCEGWGGDTYRLYAKNGNVLALWYTLWDSKGNAMNFFEAYAKIIKKKSKSLKIKREKQQSLFEAETPDGIQYMEVQGNSLIIMENVPPDLFSNVKDRLCQAETMRMIHEVKVKADPGLAKKLQQFENELNRDKSSITGNVYKNDHFMFSLNKPEKWVFRAGRARESIPILVIDKQTQGFLAVQFKASSTPASPEVLQVTMNATVSSLFSDFKSSENGTRKIGGYDFFFQKGRAMEKTSGITYDVAVFSGNIKKKVVLVVYAVPASYLRAAEADFNYLMQNITFY